MRYDFKAIREEIGNYTGSREGAAFFLRHYSGIDVTRDWKFKVRYEERTPSCVINENGSFHDYGTGEHYGDIVSLLFDGYNAFDTLTETIMYVCQEYNIDMEKYHE